MKILVEIEIQKVYMNPTEEKALRAMITNWAKIYDMVEKGMFPLLKVRENMAMVPKIVRARVNCPNCGRFCSWDARDEVYNCSCGGMRTRKDGVHLIIEKISEPRVRERLINL